MNRAYILFAIIPALLSCESIDQNNAEQQRKAVEEHERRHCLEGDFHPDSLNRTPKHYSYKPGEVEITIVESDERLATLDNMRRSQGDKYNHAGYSTGPIKTGAGVYCQITLSTRRW